MSDFQLTGEVVVEQGGLGQFEKAAEQTGLKAGKSIGEGIKAGTKDTGKQLEEALQKGAAKAKQTGKQVGDGVADGVKEGAKKIPGHVDRELKKTGKKGKGSGKKAGDQFADGFTEGAGTQIPKAVQDQLKKAQSGVKAEAKQLSLDFSKGFTQGILPTGDPIIANLFEGSGPIANKEGNKAGDQFGQGVKAGTKAAGDKATDQLFKKATAKAGPDGRRTGDAFGKGIKGGIDAQQALFATVVEQAQRAAKKVDLIFDSTTLNFKYPSGGIVPEAELRRLGMLDTEIKEAQQALDMFAKTGLNVQQGMRQAGQGTSHLVQQSSILEGAVAGLTAALSYGLLGALGQVRRGLTGMVTDFAALDKQVRLATIAAGGGGENYKILKKAIDEVGVEAAASQMQIAELATELTRAGFSAEEAAKIMPSVSRAAEGTGTEFATMASLVGASLNQFGLDVDQASRVTDVLVTSASNASTTVEEMGEALKYAAPVAAALGISLEDTTAVLSLMANNGLAASVAGTGLKQSLTRLQLAASGATGETLGLVRGQERLGEAMKALGADVLNADGSLKPMDVTIKQLSKSFKQFDKATQIELATALFGQEGASKFLGLLGNSEQQIDSMFKTIRNSKGATDKAREGMRGLQTSIDELGGSIDVMRGTFGKVIGTAIRPLIDGLSKAIDIFNGLPGPIKETIAALTLLGGALVTGKVLTLAFSAAMKNVAFKGAITEIQNFAKLLRGSFRTDIRNAKAAWLKFVRSLNKASLAAAIAALKKVGTSLKALKFQQAAKDARAFGSALVRAFQGKGKGVKQLALDLGDLSGAAKKGGPAVQQLSLALGGGAKSATAMAGAAGPAAGGLAKLGAAAGQAKLAALGLGKGAAALALAFPPATIAAAALATTVVGYNVIMGEARKVTAEVWPEIEKFGSTLNEAGIKTEDFGKKGGPVAEAMRNMGNWTNQAKEKLKQIPGVGEAAAGAFGLLQKAVENTTFGLLIRGAIDAGKALKDMYDEAKQNQAILEGAEAVEQFSGHVDKLGGKALALIKKLEQLNETGTPEELAKAGQEAAAMAQNLGKGIVSAQNLEKKFRALAEQARNNGMPELARQHEISANAIKNNAVYMEALKNKLINTTQATDEGAQAMGKFVGVVDETTQAVIELQNSIDTLDLEVTGADLALQKTQATNGLIQERFKTMAAGYQHELQQLQGVEGAEHRRKALKEKIDQIQKQAHIAQQKALADEIVQEREILRLRQEQARLKLDQKIAEANLKILEKEAELTDAQNEGDEKKVQNLTNQIALQEQIVGSLEGQRTKLAEHQQLERDILGLKHQTKQQQLETAAASRGWTTELSNVKQQLGQTNTALTQTVVKSERMADGSVRMWTETQKIPGALNQVNQGMDGAARKANEFSGYIQTADGRVVRLGQQVSGIEGPLKNAATAADSLAKDSATTQGAIGATDPSKLKVDLEKASLATKDLSQNTADLNTNLGSLPDMGAPAQDMENMGAAAQQIANSDMAGQMSQVAGQTGTISTEMGKAAGSAQAFYNSLASASGLPGSRWTGGPVAAGQSYRINELGQEAFLSNSGRLSLINKSANSMWRAPSKGVVIPAGVTAQMKERGAFERKAPSAIVAARGGSDSRVLAAQAEAIGKLQKSVDELVAKDWNVQVKVRNSEGSSALSILNRMRG